VALLRLADPWVAVSPHLPPFPSTIGWPTSRLLRCGLAGCYSSLHDSWVELRYGHGHHHFVTVSCYRRQAHFAPQEWRLILEHCLERVRQSYGLTVDAYVVMAEHVHLLVGEPSRANLSVVMQALTIFVAIACSWFTCGVWHSLVRPHGPAQRPRKAVVFMRMLDD
jgi:hypothetical protein